MTDRTSVLDFSLHASDFMVVIRGDRKDPDGAAEWGEDQLLPTGALSLSPAAAVLSYGLGVFEGLKVHRSRDGRLLGFRIRDHARRFRRSAEILTLASLPVERFQAAVERLVAANEVRVPNPGTGSLYVRALLFADEPMLGLAPCRQFCVAFYCSPVGSYFSAGAAGIRLRLLDQARVASGGTGNAKAIGNYAGSLVIRSRWQAQGYDDVLYNHAGGGGRITETTGSNPFVRFGDGTVATPRLDDQILPGVTRDSVLALLRDDGKAIVERDIKVDEILNDGRELFCTGTAWTVQPASELNDGRRHRTFTEQDTSRSLREQLDGIKSGDLPDPHGWISEIT